VSFICSAAVYTNAPLSKSNHREQTETSGFGLSERLKFCFKEIAESVVQETTGDVVEFQKVLQGSLTEECQ
jgi:hypothetical protein